MSSSGDFVEAMRKLHKHEARLVEAAHPSGEMDTRAILVSMFSFAVVAICFSPDNGNNMIDVFGFKIQGDRLQIGIPVFLVLLYWWAELIVTWKLNLERFQIIREEIDKDVIEIMKRSADVSRKAIELTQELDARMQKYSASHQSKLEKLEKRLEALPKATRLFSKEASDIENQMDAVHEEFEHNLKNDPIFKKHESSHDEMSKSFKENKEEMDRLWDRLKRTLLYQKLRICLESVVPTILFAGATVLVFMSFLVVLSR